ncbi:MAG: hypothetical protein JW832_02610 [Deltaproteobacteria bacterium]|nr:hypothetical protein [Deltaproteobacteria bacterium]
MKAKQTLIFSMLALMGAYFILPGYCFAALMLFDDKLRVKGSVYEFGMYMTKLTPEDKQYNNNNWGLMRTKGTLELLYNAYEQGDTNLNLFGFFQYWHESSSDFDGAIKDSMTSRSRRHYQGPHERADDWINELYADFYKGPWNIRVGKQIVFWSEVEMVRTIDRINPLDLRYTTPGIDPFDEMKLGLWMVRGFYTSDLPGQLVFEGIWTPDFQRVRTPLEGTALGSNPGPQGPEKLRPRAYGQNAAIDTMFRHDMPDISLKNTTFAFRVKGTSQLPYNYLLDWSLSWYHGMNTTPVAESDTLGYPNSLNLNTDTLNGYLDNLAVSRVFGAKHLPGLNNKDFWDYKYFDAIGASGQTFIPWLKGVLRGEVSYEIGVPENKAFVKEIDDSPSYSKVITGTTERDQINVGITFDRPIRWEWLQNQTWLASSGIIDTTIGWFAQKRLGDVERIRRTFGYYERSQSNWTITMRGNLWHNELYPTVRFLYNAQNWGYGVAALRYQPGKHMRYEAGYTWFFAKDPWDAPEAYCENKDFAYFRIGYEF